MLHCIVRYLLTAAALVLAVLAVACGGDDAAGTPTSSTDTGTVGLATAVTTAGAGRTATLDGERFVSDRTMPSAALSAERLEDAGAATLDDGTARQMARATAPDVADWEVVSAAGEGWLVWRPAVVLEVLADVGAGATLVLVEAVDWPDACLGATGEGEVCASVITPGYLVVITLGGERLEYHASRAGAFRRVAAGAD